MKNLLPLIIVCSTLTILSCNSGSNEKASSETSSAPAFDLQKARSIIESINVKFGEEIKRGDSAGMASHYSSDGWVMPPSSEPVKGKDIVSAWGEAIRMGVKGLKITTQDVSGGAEMLAETGTYEMYADGDKLIDKGKYVVSWKQENGEWKLYRDIWNTSMPAAK